MNKKEYTTPSMYWVWVGMSKEIADLDVYGNARSTENYVRGERNIWDEEDAGASSTPSGSKSLWDEKW